MPTDQEMDFKKTVAGNSQGLWDRARVNPRQDWQEGGLSKALEII